jgi:hypothetical protein
MPQKLTTWDNRLYFCLNKVVLRIFIALKNLSFSVGFKPANLAYSSKHDNKQTTEGDLFVVVTFWFDST